MVPHEEKKQRLLAEFHALGDHQARLGKNTSNLFRERTGSTRRIDVRDLDTVIGVNRDQQWVEVEGMAPYVKLSEATLRHGVMPAVVPQLKSITIGGAVSGVGIESSSFKFGLPHETVLEMDVLVGDGRVLTCTPGNEHRDLFFGLANSYGTLGYVLKLKARTIPVCSYVKLEHLRFTHPEAFFAAVGEWSNADIDFLDGTVFAPDDHYLTIGRFVDAAPYTSDYTYLDIYYRSIPTRRSDYLTTYDYLWRWDTDWFWCSKNLCMQYRLVRRLLRAKRLNSISYTKVMRWNARWKVTKTINRILGYYPESVIQDVDIPLDKASEFLDFLHREIGIKPIWVCPIGAYDKSAAFPLYPLDPNVLYINFGFWDSVKTREKHPPGYRNKKIERRVAELGGIKSLYSDSYYTREEFWQHYNESVYRSLKRKYDPHNRLSDLYDKCVLRR